MNYEPTPEGWKAFRQAIANINNLKGGEMWPIMGNAGYHYHPQKNTKISNVSVDEEIIRFKLLDNRTITVPLNWFPILKDANEQERNTFEIERDGEEIRFSLLNTEIHITQILLYKGLSGAEFASSCIDSSELLYALELLTWRMANESGQSIEDVMQNVEN